MDCPCCSSYSYQACCQPLHNGELHANSAEQLMRSRYSAYCLGEVDYLIKTHHPDKRQEGDSQSLKQSIEETQWLGLKVIRHKPSAQLATVEFIGFYQEEPIGQLHEKSCFIKQDGKWFYVDGDILPSIKLSRNESCFCGSKKKFKKCHGKEI